MGQNRILKIFQPTRILILAMAMIITDTTALGPKLDDLLGVQCPSDKPYLCLPYGSCCSGSEFCHQGNCESCFPQDLPESNLLSWCKNEGKNNVSLMRHSSCGMACQFRFSAISLEQCEDPIDACGCPSERPKKCSLGQCCRYDQYCEGQDCTSCFPENVTETELKALCSNSSHLSSRDSCRFACLDSFLSNQHSKTEEPNGWMFAFIGLFIVCAVVVTLTTIYLYVKQRTKRTKPEAIKTEDGDVRLRLMQNNTETHDHVVRNIKRQRSFSNEENQNTEIRTTGTHIAIEEITERDNVIDVN